MYRHETHDASFGPHGAFMMTMLLDEFNVDVVNGTRQIDRRETPCRRITVTHKESSLRRVYTVPMGHFPDGGIGWLKLLVDQFPESNFAKLVDTYGVGGKESLRFSMHAEDELMSRISTALRKVCDGPTTTLWHHVLGDLDGTSAMAILATYTDFQVKLLVAQHDKTNAHLTYEALANCMHHAWFTVFDNLGDIVAASSSESGGYHRIEEVTRRFLSFANEQSASLSKKLAEYVQDFVEETTGRITRSGATRGAKLAQTVRFAYLSLHTLSVQEWRAMLHYCVEEAPAEQVAFWKEVRHARLCEEFTARKERALAKVKGNIAEQGDKSEQVQDFTAAADGARATEMAQKERVQAFLTEHPELEPSEISVSFTHKKGQVLETARRLPQWALRTAETVKT